MSLRHTEECRYPPKCGAERRRLDSGAASIGRNHATCPSAKVSGLAPSLVALGRWNTSPEGGTE
jgi:hypothetical protein